MILLKGLKVRNFKLLRDVELDFPRQGSVLIEGLNESGKSTLFESVYFALYGVPLVAEGKGRGNLDSVIRYGADAASVELLLEVDEVELEIRRSVRRGKPTQAGLSVRPAGAPEERVSGVNAVNARVVEELGGLDGEALLNSCFVEQKKLSKLEELGASQRRDSLRKLLNMEMLTELAEGFRVTREDERELSEARGRLELAEVASQLPQAVARREQVEAALAGSRGFDDVGKGLVPFRTVDGDHGTSGTSPDATPESAGTRRLKPAATDSSLNTPDEPWRETAAHLAGARRDHATARRRGALVVGAGGVLAVLALGLALGGSDGWPWLLILGVALAIAGYLSLRSAAATRARASDIEGKLAGWRDAHTAGIGDLEGRLRRLEGGLGTRAADLDLAGCRAEVDRLGRQVEVKRRAAAMVEGAMERIVRLVLPNTERNLAQILPLLTAGRYHEARIGEDYQIQVWDDAAGRYVSKGIFSGGARDQFSLALRLAFALATLPEELGTSPGFLFLDEPLSAFDVPRTEALVRLITTGQVAASFSQIFVISHNRSFDLDAFPYRLVMRDGRVVESNLPGAYPSA